MTVPYLPSGGSTQAEMQPHSSVAARATGKVGRKSWRSFCSGSRYAGSGKQRRSMRGGLLFISALPQSTHTITSPRPRPIKVLLTTNMLPRCQGLTVANGDAIERLDHSDAGIPMKPGSLDSQHYRGCFFCWVLGSFRAALSFITRDPRAYPVLVRTRRLLRLHSWAAFSNTVERDTPANSLHRRRFKGEGRTRRSALVARIRETGIRRILPGSITLSRSATGRSTAARPYFGASSWGRAPSLHSGFGVARTCCHSGLGHADACSTDSCAGYAAGSGRAYADASARSAPPTPTGAPAAIRSSISRMAIAPGNAGSATGAAGIPGRIAIAPVTRIAVAGRIAEDGRTIPVAGVHPDSYRTGRIVPVAQTCFPKPDAGSGPQVFPGPDVGSRTQALLRAQVRSAQALLGAQMRSAGRHVALARKLRALRKLLAGHLLAGHLAALHALARGPMSRHLAARAAGHFGASPGLSVGTPFRSFLNCPTGRRGERYRSHDAEHERKLPNRSIHDRASCSAPHHGAWSRHVNLAIRTRFLARMRLVAPPADAIRSCPN